MATVGALGTPWEPVIEPTSHPRLLSTRPLPKAEFGSNEYVALKSTTEIEVLPVNRDKSARVTERSGVHGAGESDV